MTRDQVGHNAAFSTTFLFFAVPWWLCEIIRAEESTDMRLIAVRRTAIIRSLGIENSISDFGCEVPVGQRASVQFPLRGTPHPD